MRFPIIKIAVIVLLGLFISSCKKNKIPKAKPLPSNAQVLALGDSLTFGLGANAHESWPAGLEQISGWQVANFGVNGDTSSGALQRLPNLLSAQKYDAIIIGIGGNDMLRNIAADATFANLQSLIRSAKQHTEYVAIIATPEVSLMRHMIGSLKDADFYSEIAKAEGVFLISNVYADVLSDASLRSDTIHANAKGYKIIAEQIAAELKKAGWLK